MNEAVLFENEAIEWANNQVKVLEKDLKFGEKWKQIQAKVKLRKIRSLNEVEYKEAAIESYKGHLDFIHNRNYK